jgi:hypothetical protein
MIKLDNITYGVVVGALHNSFAYPIKDHFEKSGYSVKKFIDLHSKYHSRKEYMLDEDDLPAIMASLKLVTNEMTTGFPLSSPDGDLLTLLEISKLQALRLTNLLEKSITKNNSEISIKGTDWGHLG